ncbi:hypothetical protein H1R20_g380, partial [Candolleomyces eurysporus]
MALAQPAHLTKHIPLLSYSFLSAAFHLTQRADGVHNGTALWLGGQILAHYLAQYHTRFKSAHTPPRAIELGSGIGLTALALSSLGWDVLATDVEHVVNAVLEKNIKTNLTALSPDSGKIEIRELDWMVLPESWNWDNPSSVTSPPSDYTEGQPGPQLQPPFDLIITADTVYEVGLVVPLLRTLHALSVSSHSLSQRYPFVLLCIERRDPALLDHLLSEARNTWNFSADRVPGPKLVKCIEKGGLNWERGEWDGIEIWRLRLGK